MPHVKTAGGKIEICYSEDFGDRARRVRDLLADSRAFFETNFHVQEGFSIAVLNSAAWSNVTAIPYGLPFVSGPPYVVCLPATLDHPLGDALSKAISKGHLDERFSMDAGRLGNRFISLVGFHELGHIYSKAFGLHCPNKWTDEFMATYMAYCYLEADHPRQNRIWRDVSDALIREIRPGHRSLRDFEKLYVRVGVENYTWYQVVFLSRVAEVHRHMGIRFVDKLKDTEPPATSDSFYVEELDRIEPGFVQWARAYHLL